MTPDDIFPQLLKACPSAKERLEEEVEWWGDEKPGDYNILAVFAHHIVDSYVAGNTSECDAFFALLERMVRSDDGRVRELATVGLIEDIQIIASNKINLNSATVQERYAVFEPWLGFAAKLEWANVEAAWDGVSSLADMVRKELKVRKPSNTYKAPRCQSE